MHHQKSKEHSNAKKGNRHRLWRSLRLKFWRPKSRSEKTTSGPEWRPNRELGFLFAVPTLPIITADVLSNQSTPRQLRISNHEGSWVFFPKKDLDLRNIWGINLPTASSHQARRYTLIWDLNFLLRPRIRGVLGGDILLQWVWSDWPHQFELSIKTWIRTSIAGVLTPRHTGYYSGP
jgi:hypothetical protein